MWAGGASSRRMGWCCLWLIAGVVALVVLSCARLEPVQETRVLMDTFATITVYDRDKDRQTVQAAIDAAFAGMLEVELLTSCYRDSSEVNKINRAAPQPIKVSPLVFACLQEAQR
ncbi:MAG: FAD:protein FMN transferase, partial [candidate division KSB1 bacterium]|nr:FAD:protein FMN transferase [candidate division KSB1 bacterium]